MLGTLVGRKLFDVLNIANLIQIELLIYYIVPAAQTSNGIHEMIQIQKISHLFWVWGLMHNFPSKNGPMSIFFKALLAGLTNQRNISDSFAVTPLGRRGQSNYWCTAPQGRKLIN